MRKCFSKLYWLDGYAAESRLAIKKNRQPKRQERNDRAAAGCRQAQQEHTLHAENDVDGIAEAVCVSLRRGCRSRTARLGVEIHPALPAGISSLGCTVVEHWEHATRNMPAAQQKMQPCDRHSHEGSHNRYGAEVQEVCHAV